MVMSAVSVPVEEVHDLVQHVQQEEAQAEHHLRVLPVLRGEILPQLGEYVHHRRGQQDAASEAQQRGQKERPLLAALIGEARGEKSHQKTGGSKGHDRENFRFDQIHLEYYFESHQVFENSTIFIWNRCGLHISEAN